MAQNTLTVLPYVGAGQQTIFTINANGRSASVDSQSVVMSTEDKAVIDAINTSVGLLGTEATLSALNTKVVQGNGTSTTAIKVTISSDSTGQVKIATGSAVIGKLAANSGVDIGDVDVTSLPSLPAGTNNIGDVDVLSLPSLPAGANAIGTVGVTSLPALSAGTNNIGDVDVLSLPALPAGTNNIGDVDVLSLPALPAGTNNIGDVDVLTLPALPTGTNTIGSVKITDGVSTASVRALANNALNVAITDGSGNQVTSFGGGTQYAEGATAATITGTAMMMEGAANTLVVAQGTAADGLLVNLGSNNDVTVTGSVAVTGTFWQATQPVSASSLPLPSGAATAALQTQPGVDIGDVTINNASGAAAVNIQDGGNSITIDGTVAVSGSVAVTGTFWQATQPVSGTITAVTSITNALPAGTNNIGDVDVLSLPALPAGTNNIGDVDVLTLPGIVGAAAHDAAISGAPIRIGGRAVSTDFTAVGAGDAVDFISTLLGKQVTYPYALPAKTWSYAAASGGIVNTTAITAQSAGGAGTYQYISSFDVVNKHATVGTEVIIRDSTPTVLWRGYCMPGGFGYTKTYTTPLRCADNKAVEAVCVDTGAAVYVNISGFLAAE